MKKSSYSPCRWACYDHRLDASGAWPMKCKCIAFDGLGMVDEWAWRVKLTLVEA